MALPQFVKDAGKVALSIFLAIASTLGTGLVVLALLTPPYYLRVKLSERIGIPLAPAGPLLTNQDE